MDISSLVLIIYFAFRNSVRAKQKEKSSLLWAVITVASFFVCMMIGFMFVMLAFCRDIVDINKLSQIKDIKARDQYTRTATEQLAQDFAHNPLHAFTVVLFGIGGYLIVRYILERIPDKKKPEVHWMDRMGEHEQQ